MSFDEEEEQEPPAVGSIAIPTHVPVQHKQKIKIKLKVAQEKKKDIPSEYEVNEEDPLIKKK